MAYKPFVYEQPRRDRLLAGAAIHAGLAGLKAGPEGLKEGHFQRHKVPTRRTVMHRVVEGPDKAMWLTEMHSDKVGRLLAK